MHDNIYRYHLFLSLKKKKSVVTSDTFECGFACYLLRCHHVLEKNKLIKFYNCEMI